MLGLFSLFLGAPFIRAPKKRREKIISLLNLKSGQRVMDLGSGDGIILRELSRQKITCLGWEWNPLLCWWSKFLNLFEKNRTLITIERKNFWKYPFPNVDAIIIYGVPTFFEDLKIKMEKELSKETKILSIGAGFSGLNLIKEEEGLFLYSLKQI